MSTKTEQIDVQKISDELRQWAEAAQPEPNTAHAFIQTNKESIHTLRKKGVSWLKIASWIKEKGIKVSSRTLQSYMRASRKKATPKGK